MVITSGFWIWKENSLKTFHIVLDFGFGKKIR